MHILLYMNEAINYMIYLLLHMNMRVSYRNYLKSTFPVFSATSATMSREICKLEE